MHDRSRIPVRRQGADHPYDAAAGNMPYRVAIRPVGFLVASEAVDEAAVRRLAAKIAGEGVWSTPIPVDADTGIVMDGNHRTRAARQLGLSHVPCVLLSYRDPRVRVTDWQTGEPFCIETIFRSVLMQRRTLPYKTTRHVFAPALPETEIRLALLR